VGFFFSSLTLFFSLFPLPFSQVLSFPIPEPLFLGGTALEPAAEIILFGYLLFPDGALFVWWFHSAQNPPFFFLSDAKEWMIRASSTCHFLPRNPLVTVPAENSRSFLESTVFFLESIFFLVGTCSLFVKSTMFFRSHSFYDVLGCPVDAGDMRPLFPSLGEVWTAPPRGNIRGLVALPPRGSL